MNCMFLYNFSSLMIEILCLECVLDDSLGCKNPRNALECATANYWVPSQYVFCFNGIELCPTIEEFGTIMGELEIDDLIFPTIGGDLPSLLWVVLGVPTATVNRWCVFGKLNLRLIFKYFFGLALPEGERPHLYILRAFCLCAFARYFLVQNSYCLDLQTCMIAYKLKRGNPVGLILVETLNGLDAFHRKKSKLLCGKSSSP